MPINGLIPQTKDFGDSFLEGAATSQNMINSIMKNKLTPYQMELLKQQAIEASGKAQESKMIGNFYNMLAGGDPTNGINTVNSLAGSPGLGGNPGAGSPLLPTMPGNHMSNHELISHANQDQGMSDSNAMASMKPGDQYVVGSGQAPSQVPTDKPQGVQPSPSPMMNSDGSSVQEQILHPGNPHLYGLDKMAGISAGGISIPKVETTPVVNGYRERRYPSGKVVREKVAPTEHEKSFFKEGAKLAEGYDTQALTGGQELATLGQISEDINSDTWKGMRKMAGIPIAGKAELAYYGVAGTPEQKEMIGRVVANSGQIVGDMAKNFKGGFRKGEQTLIQGMKVNPSDPVDIAKGKAEALTMMANFLTNRSKMMSTLLKQGYDHSQALDMADQRLKGDLIRKVAHVKAGSPKQTEQQMHLNTENMESPKSDWVNVITPSGKTLKLPKSGADQLVKDHPDHKIVG